MLGSRDVNNLERDIEKDVRQLKTDVLMQRQQQQEELAMTDFGKDFLLTALPERPEN